MYSKRFIYFLLIFLLIFQVALSFGDERKENIDIIIALDKSLSMAEEITAVKNYVKNYIVNQLVIPGDYLLIIGFYGKTDILISQRVNSNSDKEKINKILDSIEADGRFTDIGNALDVVREELKKISNDNRRKHVLLITDGKQEAPPTSKYYSPDGKFNHEFLENAKIIQKKGWKIEILGIGTIPQGKELAEKLSGNYTALSAHPSEEEIRQKTKSILSVIKSEIIEKEIKLNYRGHGKFRVKLIPKNLKTASTIEISSITINLDKTKIKNALQQPLKIDIKPETEKTVTVQISIPEKLKAGTYKGTLLFSFSDKKGFTPALYDMDFHIMNYFQSNLFIIIPIIILLIVLMGFLIYSLLIGGMKKRKRFKLVVEEIPLKRDKSLWTISAGKNLYLNESHDLISITDHKTQKSIAQISLIGDSVRMNILNASRFPRITAVPENVLNWNFKVRSESGKDFHLRLENIE